MLIIFALILKNEILDLDFNIRSIICGVSFKVMLSILNFKTIKPVNKEHPKD